MRILIKSKARFSILLLTGLISITLSNFTAQGRQSRASDDLPFEVRLEVVDSSSRPSFTGAPTLQSFVMAQDSGRWVLLGGRTNGFHGFGPDANFPYSSANTSIWVVSTAQTNPNGSVKVYEYKLSNLPASHANVRDQLSSTNMQAYQDGNDLYVIGGYGIYGGGAGSLVTYSMLTRIDVKRLIAAIETGRTADVPAAIKFSMDDTARLQVTGGELFKLSDGYFYLVMGQSFMGPYLNCVVPNPPAPCQQVYTDQIRKFKIKSDANGNPIIDDGNGSTIPSTYSAFTDQANYHRRDLNITTTIMPDGTEGVAAYAGVFVPADPANPDANLPWRYPVYLSSGVSPEEARVIKTHPADMTARVEDRAPAAIRTAIAATPAPVKSASATTTAQPIVDYTFEQKMSPYACANLLMYDPAQKAMYTTLFGGIGRYVLDDQRNIVSVQGPPGLIPDPDPKNPGGTIFVDMVPFIPYITTLVRDARNRTTEIVHPNTMPGYSVAPPASPIFLGAESKFVPDPSALSLLYGSSKEILDFSKLPVGKDVLLGYIYGGIEANIATSKNGYKYSDWRKYGQFTTTVSNTVARLIVKRRR
jgi:hypothetical protein